MNTLEREELRWNIEHISRKIAELYRDRKEIEKNIDELVRHRDELKRKLEGN